MNKASKVVSDALLGMDFKTVIIGSMAYTIKPPTIKTICRAVRYFSESDELKGSTVTEAIEALPGLSDSLLKGLSCFICGSDKMAEALSNGTFEEVKEAMSVCISMIDISAFQCVSLMRSVSMLTASPRQ